MDSKLESLRDFYRKVLAWFEGSSLPRWAREDLKEMLDDHKEGA